MEQEDQKDGLFVVTVKQNVNPPSELHKHDGHNILKHPTQKPMNLTKKLIQSRIFKKNGSVLIPFAGSGSECVVSKKLDIPFIGVEINPEYAKFGRWVG